VIAGKTTQQWARLNVRGRCSKKSIEQLNSVSISVSLGLGLVLGLRLVLGLVLGLMPSSDSFEKYRPLIFMCPQQWHSLLD